MAVTHTGGEFPHATLALVLYQAQEVEGRGMTGGL